ncbi:MAG TPA: hypothetical protein VKQ09_03195 [Sphingomonas sp.]|nr:hypothetical protein [Sphingomonas sp.]
MLLDRAAALATKLSDYQKLRGAADEATQFSTRATQFGAAADRVARASDGLAKLRAAGVPVEFAPSEGAALAEKARNLRAAIQEDPAVINDPPFDLKYAFTDRLLGVVAAAEQATTLAWKAYVATRADFGSEDVLAALSKVPQFAVGVAKIRACRAQIASLGETVPPDPAAAKARISALLAEHDAAWSDLSADDIPRNVIGFIRAAAAGDGAPLGALTPEVQDWLIRRELLAAFRIRLR